MPGPAVRRSPVERLEDRVLLSTYWVTSVADSGAGSFRQAILDANAAAAPGAIDFKIGTGPQIIHPRSQLPYIKKPTIVDATTQPGYAGKPLIEIDGAAAGSGAYGLILSGGNSVIKGLVISNFGKFGVLSINAGGNTFENNYVGTDLTGMVKQPNGSHGMLIETGNNLIGGTKPADRNVLSGNGGSGLFFLGPASGHNVAEGNYIGVNASGTAALGNNACGIACQQQSDNTIGGLSPGAGNIISGNAGDGIILDGSSNNNVIEGNVVGANATGTAAVGNGLWGLEVQTSGNVIGGLTSAARNVFSGNKMFGVVFFRSTATNNVLEGNFIGVDITGTQALGNATGGVELTNGAANNTIGGLTPAARNIISGNHTGIALYGANDNLIEGCYLGTDFSGLHAIPNYTGIALFNSSTGNLIGGALPGAGNLVSACTQDAIDLGASGNTILDNLFGQTAIGGPLPNGGLSIRNV